MTYLLGDRLREERERLGLTQGDASLLAGVSRVAYGAWERGAMPKAEGLMKLLGQGFDINFVLGGERTLGDGTLSSEETDLLRSFREMDDEGRTSVLRQCALEARRAQSDRAAAARELNTASRQVVAHEPVPKKRKP